VFLCKIEAEVNTIKTINLLLSLREFFDNLTKLYAQRGRPPKNTEALSKLGESLASKGEELKDSLQTGNQY